MPFNQIGWNTAIGTPRSIIRRGNRAGKAPVMLRRPGQYRNIELGSLHLTWTLIIRSLMIHRQKVDTYY